MNKDSYSYEIPSFISFAQLLNAHLGTCISYIRLILTTLFLASFIVIIHVSAMQLLSLLSLFDLPNYQMISRGKYCLNHGGLIYL